MSAKGQVHYVFVRLVDDITIIKKTANIRLMDIISISLTPHTMLKLSYFGGHRCSV